MRLLLTHDFIDAYVLETLSEDYKALDVGTIPLCIAPAYCKCCNKRTPQTESPAGTPRRLTLLAISNLESVTDLSIDRGATLDLYLGAGLPFLNPSISEDLGPVRLVAAGRSLAQEPEIHRSCPKGSVEEFLLWREVAVMIGEELNKTRCFSFRGAQLVMVAAQG